MMDFILHLINFCASCASDSNALPAAAGALGGAAAAAGGLGGLSGAGGAANGVGSGEGIGNGSGPSANPASSGASGPGANAGGPTPIGDTPPAGGPQPIGEPNANSPGPKPIGDQGTLPSSPPGTLGMGTNPDGSLTYDDGNTGQRYTTPSDGSGPIPLGETSPPPGSAAPIGEPTADSPGPKPIGDQGTLPPSPPGTVAMGTNADGSLTYDDGNTGQRYTTPSDGSGPIPLGETSPPVGSASPIGEPTADSPGPKPIGDQGTLPTSPPGTIAMGTNADGSQTFDDGNTGERYTTPSGGGGPTPIGDTPPASGPQPIGEPTADSPGPKSIGPTSATPDADPANSSTPDATSDTPDSAAADAPDDPTGSNAPDTPTPAASKSAGAMTDTLAPGPNATVAKDGTTSWTTPDGITTTLKPDGSSNVSANVPPAGSGLTTGPGATDPNDPQQGQQPIGYTVQDLSPFSSSDPSQLVDPKATIGDTVSVSDMPNVAHVQGPGDTGTLPHKPHTP